MANLKEIAQMAGVSMSTVSNALNGRKNVGEETRQRILKLCREMSYYPNAAGQNLKNSGTNHTILFNFSDFDRTFYLDILSGINDYAIGNGFDLMVCTKYSCEKFIRSGLTRGCIILDMAMENELLLNVASERYPIVVLDRYMEHPHIKSITVNNYDPMSELVQGLVERGYRRFAFIGGPERTDDTIERFAAFSDVLSKQRIPFEKRNYHMGDYRQKSGYMVTKIMILSNELPECIVCANDNMAIGAIKVLRESGYRVPEDVAVTGFDDCNLAELMGLTTVAIPNYERGYIAAQQLIESIRGAGSVDRLSIGAKVTWRKTVGKVKK